MCNKFQISDMNPLGNIPTTPIRNGAPPHPQYPSEATGLQSSVPLQSPSTPVLSQSPYPIQYAQYHPHLHYHGWYTPYPGTPTPNTAYPSTPTPNTCSGARLSAATNVIDNFRHYQPPNSSRSGPNTIQSRKRSNPTLDSQNTRNVRPRTSADKENSNVSVPSQSINPTPTAAVAGAGPIPASSLSTDTPLPPALDSAIFKSAKEKQKKADSGSGNSAATDCWHFIVPADTHAVPPINPNMKLFRKRPSKCLFLACRLCLEGAATQGIFQNGGGRLTRNIRRHLKTHHGPIYNEFVLKFKLKGWESIDSTGVPISKYDRRPNEEFSPKVFMELLVRWIVVDDQSINVVEVPEFRDLLSYIGLELTSGEIPHRTKLMELIFAQFEREFSNVKAEIQNSLGRYMAVTAHYMIQKDGHLVMKSRLVAFRHVEGSHDGLNMATYFFTVLKELGITNRIGMITLDNASNNNTMMRSLERVFHDIDVEFSAEGNCICCFPHVVNIAVKTGLSRLTYSDQPQGFDDADGVTEVEIQEFLPTHPNDDIPADYRAALQTDLVSKVRKLVNACQASGKRRANLHKIIIEIREADLKKKEEEGIQITDEMEEDVIKVVVLLRDVDTCWSSIYLMINRLLDLYEAVQKFAQLDENEEIRSLLLSQAELHVLKDIQLYLKTFHLIQELVSGQKTPTISFVLPLYEQLIANLKTLKIVIPRLSHMIESSLEKLYEYVDKARSTHMYAFALVINPTSKMRWIEQQWSAQDASNAKSAILDVMTRHQTAARHEQVASKVPGRVSVDFGGSNAAHSLQAGFDNLDVFTECLQALSRTASASSFADEPATTLDQNNTDPSTDLERENEALIKDRRMAEEELHSWIGEGILKDKKADLVRFWDDKTRQDKYPSLFRLALDVLPVQASAVPCERAFSSSKETDADRRSRMSTVLVEVLQILKDFYRDDRLNFSAAWVAKPSEMAEEDVHGYCTESDIVRDDGLTTTDLGNDQLREMLMQGQVQDLLNLIEASYNTLGS
ncbi:hypothetical protein D9758_008530 [Tetrapyrgos nigripes]|uniref:HAT C-terminal dimerisation domain-containing protein n=1 Tax=Tetrapyrgos nigripes TaxID=182062 RepID=A0A8H5G5M3_9AGAR|nr:hypothetical protein D9758_008530 [Tetrapyrgos nigripes]